MVRQLERWAPLAGIIFVALMVSGTYLVADVPDPDARQQEFADYLTDSDNHTRNIIGVYMWVVGGLLFLWFLTHLRSVLRAAEGGTDALSNLVFGAGVVYTAVWMTSAATFASLAYAVEVRDASVSNPDFVRVLPQIAWLLLLVGAGFAALFLVLIASVVIFQTRVLPRWLAWLGFVVAIALLFDVLYVNIVPFLIWVVAAAIVLLMRRDKTATAPA
jgi:hypothetical protein